MPEIAAETAHPARDRPSPSADPSHADPELAAERRHLAESRTALGYMREQVLALDARVAGGDRLNIEYLKAALHRRADALLDDPETPLFFGRIDAVEPKSNRYYIGRRHVHDSAGEPMVLDWRADLSRAFYRASARDPMGLARRRRFGFAGGELTAYEDEPLGAPGAAPVSATSRILTEEIERPRVGPMRDIVATIQPDQDDLVRAGLDTTICVQGAPGTGKTAVGLHRAAYLLYAFRERLSRSGVLIVGPSRQFLSYIGNVLPALGEVDVRQVTLSELVGHVPIRGADADDVAAVKGDARMATVLERALWSHVSPPAGGLIVTRGSRRHRLSAGELSTLVERLRDRGLRYSAGRGLLPRAVAASVCTLLEAEGTATDDRTEAAIARNRDVRVWVDAAWPKVDAVTLVGRLLTDADFLAAAAQGVLDPAEQALLRRPLPRRGVRGLPWSHADAVLIDEAKDLVERTRGVGHVILDEAQDLSSMEYRVIGRRCALGSATVLGDLAQGTTPWAADRWTDALNHLGKPDGQIDDLTQGYRVPRDIIAFASRLLPHIGHELAIPSSVRRTSGSLTVQATAGGQAFDDAVTACCRTALSDAGSIGVICADSRVKQVARLLNRRGLAHVVLGADGFGERLTVVPAALAKGLEFDHVVVVEPAEIVAAEARGLRRLYVVLTRAVSSLTVVHSRPLPAPLAG